MFTMGWHAISGNCQGFRFTLSGDPDFALAMKFCSDTLLTIKIYSNTLARWVESIPPEIS